MANSISLRPIPIPRIFGEDKEEADLQVETAGINHLSFIRKGTYKGKGLFARAYVDDDAEALRD